ncbi:MAG: hypothetical protein IJS08_13710 [Victivallales bacterium]|nr:hypothetical protein [Victivallales bacterium]
MNKRFTTDSMYNGKEIRIKDGTQADIKVLDAIEESIEKALDNGAGTMLLYEMTLPRQYNQGGGNNVFLKTQADLCKFQKRADKSCTSPRYIGVRDLLSEDAPRYKVVMFLPKESNYDKEQFEDKANEITNGKMKDWTAFKDGDLMAMCSEKYGVEVKDVVPLDGTKEASDEAFYVASELAAVKIEPRMDRTLFRSKKTC